MSTASGGGKIDVQNPQLLVVQNANRTWNDQFLAQAIRVAGTTCRIATFRIRR